MSKKVLSIGQCYPDHSAIRRLIEGNFAASVVPAALPHEAIEKLREEHFDLVLVNRKLDADYSDGLEVIRQIKADKRHADVPVMLITNYEEHQKVAVAAGAVPGFGKLEYSKVETRRKLSEYLA